METFVSEGGFGSICRRCGFCKTTESCSLCVAVKRILGTSSSTRLEEEAMTMKLLSTLASPHIVRFIAWEREQLIMEYVSPFILEGRTCATFEDIIDLFTCRDATIPSHLLVDIIVQIVGTLMELQRAIPGFRHGDLHPGNLLLQLWPADQPPSHFTNSTGDVFEARGPLLVKIADFGNSGVWHETHESIRTLKCDDDYGGSALASPLFDVYRLMLFVTKTVYSRWAHLPDSWGALFNVCVHTFGENATLGRTTKDHKAFADVARGCMWPKPELCSEFKRATGNMTLDQLLSNPYFASALLTAPVLPDT